MTSGLDSYSQEYFDGKVSFYSKWLPVDARPTSEPKAFLLGGQSGAGKTRLHKVCSAKLDGNVIVINGDEFRKAHPHFTQIQELYGIDAPAHTAKWAGAMTEGLIDAFSMQGYNLVVEGTLRTSEVPLRTARLLRDRGYLVQLAVMAVKPEISLVSCQIRYEMMRAAGTIPRAVDPAHHDKIVHDIVDNIAALEESGLFDGILIFNRAEQQLYPESHETRSAGEALREALFGPWSAEERHHLEHLQARLAKLGESNAPGSSDSF